MPRDELVDGSAITVMVTGAGGPAGVAVIQALASRKLRVIGVDADPLAVGLRLADQGAVLPRATQPSFVGELLALAGSTGAQALVCTVAEEMPPLAAACGQLRAAGLATWLAPPHALELCMDKWRFAQAMRAAGVAVPPTGLGSEEGVPGPWIVKPRFGRGSRDVYAVDDRSSLAWAMDRVNQPLVQTRLGGREFTVDLLATELQPTIGAVARWRLETKSGISTKGRTFCDDRVLAAVGRLVTAVGLTGAANVQGFVSPQGDSTFIEVNPRFSGGLPLSLAAGADLVGEYLRGVMGLPVRSERLHYRSGVTMLRYFQEIILEL